jgi:protein-S-isoprenylcysteine O-methyltransferase
VRHPSYFGWFLWALGTQLLLNNPICFVLWFFAAVTFFKDRVDVEEFYLLKFFREDYIEYAAKTPIGIPFVKMNRQLEIYV